MAIDDNTSYELTGYQVKDLAQKIRAKADASAISAVGYSNLYSDLTGTPTIPTVYNGTLTITQGGNTLGTFTANSSSNVTIDVPAGGSTYTAGTGIDITNDVISANLTAGSNIQINGAAISATDTTYSDFTGATSSAAGTSGLVPAPTTADTGKVLKGDGTWGEKSEKFVIMKYGEASAWAKFLAAYKENAIVYCRASSNSNPATGSQTRLAFMAYVSNETNPTSVEFQYVRSVGTKTSSQPVDQVYVYKLESTNGGTWSVQTRDMAPKLAAGTNASVSYSGGTYTVSATDTTYSDFTGTDGTAAGAAGLVPAPATTDAGKFLKADGTWAEAGSDTLTVIATDLYGQGMFQQVQNKVQQLGVGSIYNNLHFSLQQGGTLMFIDEAKTRPIAMQEISQAFEDGKTVIVRCAFNTYVLGGQMEWGCPGRVLATTVPGYGGEQIIFQFTHANISGATMGIVKVREQSSAMGSDGKTYASYSVQGAI